MTNPGGNTGSGIDPGGLGGLGGAGLLIPGVGGVIDTFVNAQTARRNTDKTIEAQKREAELAYQRQVAMWHLQNAYNSPAEQMKRFGAAGLNPHLIYGQGSAGNASGTPSYQPPNIQYRYAAPAYGGALASVLPTLMSVGTWMQNMRLSEAELESKKTNIDKAQQLIEFLSQSNPRKLRELDNRLSLYPYQRDMADYSAQRVGWQVNDMVREYGYRWGSGDSDRDYGSGTKKLDYLRKLAETRLKGAQASWTDYSLTNPQALIQLVMSGVMGMAGQQMRLSTGRINPKAKRVKTFYQDGKRRSQVVDY